MKRSALGVGRKSLERGSSFKAAPKPLARKTALKPSAKPRPGRRSTLSPGKGFAVSKAQREHVRGRKCAVTECFREDVDAAHLIGRGFLPDTTGDPLAVIPLCRPHHRLYDDKKLDLLGDLEPSYRAELAYAVEHAGLIAVLEHVTNLRWQPVPGSRAV